MKRPLSLILLILAFIPMKINGQSRVDSAIRMVNFQNPNDARFFKTCSFIVDSYMDLERYDSAQIWLNKIYDAIPEKEISIRSYFLSTRQAEVYYYNNLMQFGWRQSKISQTLASQLNDSILLADSYNILGLVLMNMDSLPEAIQAFKSGLIFSKQPPYLAIYPELSNPQHLYCNLAEAYYHQHKYDSAFYYFKLALHKAQEVKKVRGEALSYLGLADVYLAMQEKDSAKYYYQKAIEISKTARDIDVTLIAYKGLSKSYAAMNQTDESNRALDLGYELLIQNPNLNHFYSLEFLEDAIDIYKKNRNDIGLIKCLEQKIAIEASNITAKNDKIQRIINTGLANENKLLKLEVEKAMQKQELANTRLILSLIGLALLGVVFWAYRYYQRQKNIVASIRHRISQDLHDDIGASLSSLQIYGTIGALSIKEDHAKTQEMLDKINSQSREILENMSDIVWSIKSATSDGISLEAKVKNFSLELFQESQIEYHFNIQPQADKALKNMQARKNILLIIREIFNNCLKHSGASRIDLRIFLQDRFWVMEINDDGIGMDVSKEMKGNGLANIKQRCEDLNGEMKLVGDNGTSYTFYIPYVVVAKMH